MRDKNHNELKLCEISPFIGIIGEKRTVVMLEGDNLPQTMNLTSIITIAQFQKDSFIVVNTFLSLHIMVITVTIQAWLKLLKLNVFIGVVVVGTGQNLKDSIWYIKQLKNPFPVNSRGIFMFNKDIVGSND